MSPAMMVKSEPEMARVEPPLSVYLVRVLGIRNIVESLVWAYG